MIEIKIKQERGKFNIPVLSTEHSVCYDVFCSNITNDGNGTIICNLGFSTEIPVGWKGVIVPRSGITKTGWVMQNSPGQVDSDYRGEWQIRFKSIDGSEFPFKVGDRVGQIYFEPVHYVTFKNVESITETVRGSGGFGHTGK